MSQAPERDHAWPASNCAEHMQRRYEAVEEEASEDARMKNFQEGQLDDHFDWSVDKRRHDAKRAALSAHSPFPCLNSAPSVTAVSGLWLGRVCRTASHKLGHCFGMDHCVHYACSTQGTASVIEDARQPPYLCPIDLTKVLKATGAGQNDRYSALLAFCEKHKDAQLFAAYAAWIRARLS